MRENIAYFIKVMAVFTTHCVLVTRVCYFPSVPFPLRGTRRNCPCREVSLHVDTIRATIIQYVHSTLPGRHTSRDWGRGSAAVICIHSLIYQSYCVCAVIHVTDTAPPGPSRDLKVHDFPVLSLVFPQCVLQIRSHPNNEMEENEGKCKRM